MKVVTTVALQMVLQDYNLLPVCPVSFVFGDNPLNQLESQWKHDQKKMV